MSNSDVERLATLYRQERLARTMAVEALLGAEIDSVDYLDTAINRIQLTGALGQKISLWIEAWGSEVASLVIQINGSEPISVDILCNTYPEEDE